MSNQPTAQPGPTGDRSDGIAEGPVGLGLIGCGNIGGEAHAPALMASPDTRLLAVCDADASRASRLGDFARAPVVTLETLETDPAIEAVVVATPTPTHASIAGRLLAAGKHVLVEKPLAGSLGEARRLLEEGEASRAVLMVGHVRRFDPRFRAAAEQLDHGAVGKVVYLRRAERQWLPLSEDAWMRMPDEGIVLDVGIHAADLVRWLLGEPQSVYATGHRLRPEANRSGRHDHVLVTFALPDGVTAVAELSWTHPRASGTQYQAFEVVGTAGTLRLGEADTPLVITGADAITIPRYSPLVSSTPEAFADQLAQFVRLIRGHDDPVQTPADAARSLALCEAIATALRTGAPVNVEAPP